MAATTTNVCRICGDVGPHAQYLAKEMMYGMPDRFPYFECRACGCVQITAVPSDLGRFYPQDYYSMRKISWLRRVLKQQRARFFLRLGALARLVRGRLTPPAYVGWLREMGWRREMRLLDVGCGHGALLDELRGAGCAVLDGADPFVEGEVRRGALHVRKAELSALDPGYDIVMLHHSLEHMADQKGVMRELRRLVAPNGTVLVRIPLSSSFAWRHYRCDWVALDAPRHLYLHTVESFSRLAREAGFDVAKIEHDSTDLQLWASEQYRRGIPLEDGRSYLKDPTLFTPAEIDAFRARAAALNAAGDGDAAAFYLKPAATSAARPTDTRARTPPS